jgi:uncharacterized membrane protein YhdT
MPKGYRLPKVVWNRFRNPWPLTVEFITESVDKSLPLKRLSGTAAFGIIFFAPTVKRDNMDILMIVLSLLAAYVLFVSVCYLLMRLIFPKIEVADSDEVMPVRTRTVNHRYATRAVKKQKNLAY